MTEEMMGALVGIVFFLTVGGVILLKPITNRLGEFLEVLIQEKRDRSVADPETRQALESMQQRLTRLEDQMTFTERLLASSGTGGARPGDEATAEHRQAGGERSDDGASS